MFANLAALSSLGILPYCLLGLLAMAEGPVATLLGGAATSHGLLLPLPAYLSIVAGNLIADTGWYLLGRFSPPAWLQWVVVKARIDPVRVAQLQDSIQQHAPRLLFLAKLTVGFPIPTLLATGISRAPVRRWAGMLALGEMIKTAALAAVGYFYAEAIQQVSGRVQVILWGITAAVVMIGLIISLTKFSRRKR